MRTHLSTTRSAWTLHVAQTLQLQTREGFKPADAPHWRPPGREPRSAARARCRPQGGGGVRGRKRTDRSNISSVRMFPAESRVNAGSSAGSSAESSKTHRRPCWYTLKSNQTTFNSPYPTPQTHKYLWHLLPKCSKQPLNSRIISVSIYCQWLKTK